MLLFFISALYPPQYCFTNKNFFGFTSCISVINLQFHPDSLTPSQACLSFDLEYFQMPLLKVQSECLQFSKDGITVKNIYIFYVEVLGGKVENFSGFF